jgi:hypothetical protein
MQGRKNEIGRKVISSAFDLFIYLFSSLFQSFRSALSTDLSRNEKRWTKIRPMYSPARVNKLLAYPRANADNPAVPGRLVRVNLVNMGYLDLLKDIRAKLFTDAALDF